MPPGREGARPGRPVRSPRRYRFRADLLIFIRFAIAETVLELMEFPQKTKVCRDALPGLDIQVGATPWNSRVSGVVMGAYTPPTNVVI
jgi:hypothetical protein